MKRYKALQNKREEIFGKIIIGIDPSKKKHQIVAIDKCGIPIGNPFCIPVSYEGYNSILPKKLKEQIPNYDEKDVVFAIENSANLWQTLSHHLHKKKSKVLLVNPITTYRSRPMLNLNFSRTDPKDALVVASNSKNGYFNFYREFSPQINAMHRLGITYDKLRRNLVQQKNRLHSLLDIIFPEFFNTLNHDTDTALYLLKKYFLPQHFIDMDISSETKNILKISNNYYNSQTLDKLKESAKHTIGIPQSDDEILANRMSLDTWILLIENIKDKMETIMHNLILLAKQTPYFKTLTNLKGISDIISSLFIAEIRDFSLFSHFKQIEKLAGYNLNLSQSGQQQGLRHISHFGSRRLSWILYRMTEEAVRYIPEVRIKYLKRQIQKRCHRKNVVACAPVLLKLIFSLIKENRVYEYNQKSIDEMKRLENIYETIKNKKMKLKNN